MDIHLVRHEKVGIGYAVKYCHKNILKVRFMGSIDLPITFPLNSFDKGYLVDLGVVDNTEKNALFS
jgi:hypothetical protein